MIISADRFKHMRFERSKITGKKYDAIIMDIITRKIQRVPFGNQNIAHYQDTTGMKLYSRLDNMNERQRTLYIDAYNKTNKKKYSSDWYSAKFLYGL